MKTEDLYKKKNECCGCELCSQSCPQGIIDMKPDEAGFLYPFITDNTQCINCKKCIKVCPFKAPGRNNNKVIRSFSFSLQDINDLKKSASGGLVTELSRKFIGEGGVVYGTAYTDFYESVIYERATTVEELERYRGSKYVQAKKNGLYKLIKHDLKNGMKVLFVGLPCEVSAVYHSVGDKENLYTISLICHGPTSQKVHRDYCESIRQTEGEKVKFMSVRYKLKGWKPYFIHVEYENGRVYNEQFSHSDYNTAFLYMKRPSCRTCQYKAETPQFGILSDIIAGDYHAVNKGTSQYNMWGVSQCSVLTSKGEYLCSLLPKEYEQLEIPYEIIRTTNRGMYMAIPQRGSYNHFVKDYANHSLHYACNSSMVRFNNKLEDAKFYVYRIKNVLSKISELF